MSMINIKPPKPKKNKKGVEYTSKKFRDLSPQQKEVLYLLKQEYLTPAQVAKRRHTSIQAVYKTVGKLKKSGHFSIGNEGGLMDGGPSTPQPHQIRLHGQQFKIKIVNSSEYYQRMLKTRKARLKQGAIKGFVNFIFWFILFFFC